MSNPTITQFTTPVPTRNDPANFSARANTLVSELPQFVDSANEVAEWINDQAGEIATTASEVDSNRALAQSAATSAGNNAVAVEAARSEVETNAEQVATDRTVVEAAADGALASHVDPDYPTADANKGGYGEGDIVLVLSDTNYDDAATYYEIDTGALAFLGLADGFNTSAYPHLAQNKSIHFWMNKLLAKTGESIQATPSLELDFENDVYKVEGENKTFAEAITYTRASDATLNKASGKVATVSTDEPQFTYDPETKERALLLEPSCTNLLTYSEQFDNAAWIKSNATVNANAATAPDGTLTADELVLTTTGSAGSCRQAGVFADDAPNTYSAYVKKGTALEVQLVLVDFISNTDASMVYNFAARTFTAGAGVGNITNSSVTELGNGWLRLSFTITEDNGAAHSCRIQLAASEASGSTVYLWGAQLEEGFYPTSYIKTEGSTATRAANSTVAAIGDWFNPKEGTIVFEADPAPSDEGFFFQIGDATNGRVSLRVASANLDNLTVIYDAGGSTGNTTTNLADGNLDRVQAAISYVEGGALGAASKGVYSETAGSLPAFDDAESMTDAAIGAASAGSSGSSLGSGIKKLTYYPKALTEAQLIALTSGAA